MLVVADNHVLLYVGWEGTMSYPSIGFLVPQAVGGHRGQKRHSWANRVGDAGLAVGMFLTRHFLAISSYAGVFSRRTRCKSRSADRDRAVDAVGGVRQVRAGSAASLALRTRWRAPPRCPRDPRRHHGDRRYEWSGPLYNLAPTAQLASSSSAR